MTTMKFDGGIEFEDTQWTHKATGVKITAMKSGEFLVEADDGYGADAVSVVGDNSMDRAFSLALALARVVEGNKKR